MESKAERALAEALAGAVLRADPGDNERMLTRLAALSGREWLRLDQSARPLARESPLAWVTGWPSRLAAMLESLSEAGERGGRLWALSARAERELLAAGELEARAMRDRDPVVALWCARQLAALPAWRRAGSGPRLLGSARASVRDFAVRQLADDLLPPEVLRGLLADRSGIVRSVARWRWARTEEDPGQVYRDLLAAPLPRQVAAALQGLDDVGDGCLPDAAMPFLTYPSPRVRHAAVYAVGRHSGPGDLPARLAPALRDESDKVVAAALRFLRGYRLPAAVLDDLDAAGTPRSRRTALAIRQRLSPWDRIHADLTAISGPDPELADTGRADLLAWLRHGAATTYGRPSPGRAAQIAALLATSSLGAGARREVAFVAGIR
jgi:hypothetical protein